MQYGRIYSSGGSGESPDPPTFCICWLDVFFPGLSPPDDTVVSDVVVGVKMGIPIQ